MFYRLFIFAAALALAPGEQASAQAQSESPAQAQPEARSDGAAGSEERLLVVVERDEGLTRRTALAAELLALSAGPNFAKTFERAMTDQLEAIGDKSGEEAAWVRANMPPMLSRMVARMMEQMAPIYAAHYTEEELRGQIEFARSPVGRSIAEKTVPVAMAVQELQTSAATEFLTEFGSKYCARFDCGEGAQVEAKPSRR